MTLATIQEFRSSKGSRGRHRIGVRSEPLESRRLLDAAQSFIAPNLSAVNGLPVVSLATGTDLAAVALASSNSMVGSSIAAGLPVAGLATGSNLAAPFQSFGTFQASVSLRPISSAFPPLSGSSVGPSTFGPSGTGPSTTLNPLGNDSETANAAAFEINRPTPGFFDRISSDIVAPRIVPVPHYPEPQPRNLAPAPDILPPPPAKSLDAPARPQAEPTPIPKAAEPAPGFPDRSFNAAPATEPKGMPPASKDPMTLQVWDTALEFVEADVTKSSTAASIGRAEGTMAFAAVLAAWGGWRVAARAESRSRPQSQEFITLQSGPGASGP